MAFTMPSYPLLNREQASPFADLVKNALGTYGQAVNARYAPQMTQAEIFNKEFAPLAQIASSPLAMAMLPEQRQQMAALISQLLKQTGAPGGGMPVGGGLGALFGGGAQQPTGGATGGGYAGGTGGMVPSGGGQASSGYNPLVPQAGGDLGQGATAKVTAPYQAQTQPAGTTYYDPNSQGFYSAPTGGRVDQAQATMTSYNNLKELIPSLLEESKKFENKSLELKRAGISQTLHSYGLGGIGNLVSDNPELAGDYNNFIQDINKAGIVLQGIYPASHSQESYNQHMAMLSFDPSKDTYKTYRERLQKLLEDSSIAYKNAQQQAGGKGGFNLSQAPEVPNLQSGNSPNMAPPPKMQNYTNEEVPGDQGFISINAGDKFVKMKTPDGRTWKVPVDKINDAINLGARQTAG